MTEVLFLIIKIELNHQKNNPEKLKRKTQILGNTSDECLHLTVLSCTEDHNVTEGHLELVRQNVGSNWKQVARKLGLTDIDVDTIEHDYDRDGLAEKVHQTLERWKMKEGLMSITVGKLCRALERCIKSSVLLELLLKCQDCSAVP